MNAIPARCDIGEGLSDGKAHFKGDRLRFVCPSFSPPVTVTRSLAGDPGEDCIEIKALNGVTLNDPDAAFHWVKGPMFV